MDHNNGNSSDCDNAQGSVSDMLDDSEWTQGAAGMENCNLEETGDAHNQTSSIDNAEDSHGACAAGGQERTFRSHDYHDEEKRKFSPGTSTNALADSSDTSSVLGLDRAHSGTNVGRIPWLLEGTFPDTEVTVGRPLAVAVTEDSSNDSVALGQLVAGRWVCVGQILQEVEEHQQFLRESQNREQWIREQRDVERRMREERQPQQQQADVVCSQQLQFSRREPSQNCDICGMNVDQQHQEYHLCQPTDYCMCFGCIIDQRVGERRVREEGEIQEAVERQPQGQEAVAVNSQQLQFSRMEPTHNCGICGFNVDNQLILHQECEPYECCICLGLLDPVIECHTFPCSHKIHVACAIELLKKNHQTCPLCRAPVF